MANLSESATYDAGVIQIETTDPVLGGPGGIANRPHQALANRTAWLKAQVDALLADVAALEGLTGAASEAAAGIAEIATQAEVDAGTDDARIVTALKLATRLAALAYAPVGSVIWVPGNAAPAAHLKLNGALVSRTTYAALWAYAQASGNLAASDGAWQAGQFSPGDGASTFRLPDYRGEFFRGWDDGRGVDAGRAIGTWQADEIEAHLHALRQTSTGGNQDVATGEAFRYVNGGGFDFGESSEATGGAETRPRNVAVLACIRYQ